MAFDEAHWKDPRRKIATDFFGNDYGYMLHGGKLFIEFLRASDIQFSMASRMRVLDYGCGTGRVTRLLALLFKEAVGYDPVPECIEESLAESVKAGAGFKSPYLTSLLTDVGDGFDVVVSINVLEHLRPDVLDDALNNIEYKLKEGGCCYLWCHKEKNADFFVKHRLRLPSANISVIRGVRSHDGMYYESVDGW